MLIIQDYLALSLDFPPHQNEVDVCYYVTEKIENYRWLHTFYKFFSFSNLFNVILDYTKYIIAFCLTLMVRGAHCIVPHLFQTTISSWKEGSRGPKFLDFSSFIINFPKINKWGGHSALKLQKSWPIWVKCVVCSIKMPNDVIWRDFCV